MKKVVCQATDKQFGSKARAMMAARVLLEVWNLGATSDQLQHIKKSGVLFGVRCGK